MPYAYPAAPPTLSGDLETISRFLQSPTMLRRRLRNFQDLRFISDQILTQRFRTQGGAILYEQSEPFTTDRTVQAVGPGAEYPYANLPTGTGAISAVSKWGQKVKLTDEEITRNVYGGAAVDRCLRKVVNSVIAQVDSVTLSAINSAVTLTSAAAAVWNTGTPNILRDILNAAAKITKLNLGYVPDTLLVTDDIYAILASDATITNALQRETSASPVYTGSIEVIAGLRIIRTGLAKIPGGGTGTAFVLDSNQLGGMADEADSAPGYAVDQLAVEVKSIRSDTTDSWDLQGRRKTVPVIQETGAICKITTIGTTE